MCMVSNIGDQWSQDFPHKWPQIQQPYYTSTQIGVSQSEFDALRKEVEELKKLLLAAKKFDEATGQPDCEMDEKVELIKSIAKLVGVDIGGVFGKKPPKRRTRQRVKK